MTIYTINIGEQEAILALIAGIFTILVASKNNKSRYITQDREKWRDRIRDWIVEVTQIIYDGWDNNKLEAKKNEMLLRLNPKCDEVLQSNISKLKLKNEEVDNELKNVVENLQYLLKHDWEKVKKNHSIFGGTQLLNISLIITSAYYLIVTKQYFRFDQPTFDIKYLWILLLVLIGKLFITEIEKIPFVREKTGINVFNHYQGSINLPSLVEIVVSALIFIYVGCATKEWILSSIMLLLITSVFTIWLIMKIHKKDDKREKTG